MEPIGLAIFGLVFWLWSHEARHSYEQRPGRLRLGFWVILSLIGLGLLLAAATTVVTA